MIREGLHFEGKEPIEITGPVSISDGKVPGGQWYESFGGVTRVELIENGRRAYVTWDAGNVNTSVQDDGKTLKIFVSRGYLPGDLVRISVHHAQVAEFNERQGVVVYGPDNDVTPGWLVCTALGTIRCTADELTMVATRENRHWPN